MFPFIDLPALPLPFGQKIDVFGVLSTAGVITGALLAARAAKKYGPGDDTPLRDVVPWAVIIGLFGGHFMHIFAYHPELVRNVPLTLLMVAALGVVAFFIYRQKKWSDNARWAVFIVVCGAVYLFTKSSAPDLHADFMTAVKAWDGLSSMGGVLGALAGIFIFFRKEKIPLTPYLDALALGTAPGWAIARIGCYLVHDHPGWRTDFFLAVAYPERDSHGIFYGGPRHDLGLYDFFVLAAISGLIWALRKKLYGTGMLMGLLAVIYSVCRFSLDFLRASDLGFVDKRYGPFTPAQFVVTGIFIVGLRLLWQGRQKLPLVSSPALTAKGR